MNDDLDIDNLSEEELESAKQVVNVDKNVREETLEEAFVNRIEETIETGDTGYSRTIIFPIPIELIKDSKDTKNFLKDIGKISRDKDIKLPVKMEKESVEEVVFMNLIIKPTQDTDLQAIKNQFNL